MKTYETKVITRKEEVLVKTICDWCGQEFPKEEPCKVEETSLFYKTGYSYSSCYSTTITEADICPLCFTDKLIPLLKTNGVNFHERDNDW